jgi:hypothetical protein
MLLLNAISTVRLPVIIKIRGFTPAAWAKAKEQMIAQAA